MIVSYNPLSPPRRKRTEKHVTVNVDGAAVTGRSIRIGANSYVVGFTGVPYAESPTGLRRFDYPVKLDYSRGL